MTTNNYQEIKDFILSLLSKTKGVLHEKQIENTILSARVLLEKASDSDLNLLLGTSNSNNDVKLTDEDWIQMQRDLEMHFDVKMDRGYLIQGEEQKKHDKHWWSDSQKQQSNNYYWNRYKTYISTDFSPNVIKTIDDDTDVVMNNLENPTFGDFNRYGMVVGHVQSGKTANYSALICKAADAGYKFIVVIAGGTNSLRNQTQIRINQAFVGQDKGIPVGVGLLGDVKRERMPISLTTAEQDFNQHDAKQNSQGVNFENINSPILVVIKKNSRALKNVVQWLKAQYRNRIPDHSMLLIDDESDYASVNTRNEDDPTGINKLIRELLGLFQKSTYVAYTATPYANIFIDHEASTEELGLDLFPKDFIYAIKAPSNYFGARSVFLEENNDYIVEIDDYSEDLPMHHKKDHQLNSIPESLKEAIRLFTINIAIRSLRGQGKKHNSMLVHATRFTSVHQGLSIEIGKYLEKIKNEVTAFGRLPNPEDQSEIIKEIKTTFKLRLPNIKIDWHQLIDAICLNVNSIVVREVHQESKIPIEYSADRPTNAIAVGGTSLSRGFTLEGLSVSYFLRNSVFYDTLMQMGRWFGYRTNYEDLCRIFIPESIKDKFAFIIEATEDLFDDFERMATANKTPYDFGLCVRQHPDSLLQVTARNKQRNATTIYFEMQLDGHLKETAWLNVDSEIQAKNINAMKRILVELLIENKLPEKLNNSYLWRNIEKSIIQKFLENFQTYQSNQANLGNKMPIEFVKQYVADDERPWDVALYGGNSEEFKLAESLTVKCEKRKIENKGEYFQIRNRQVSSGSAEAIALNETDRTNLANDRKGTRERMKNPLLMLHVLKDDDSKIGPLAAFGISFPGGIDSPHKTVRRLVNSVYIRNVQQELLNEEGHDD